MHRRISTGSPFEAEYAYSRAVVRGDWCFVAGTTGYDYATMTMPDAAEAQGHERDEPLAAFGFVGRGGGHAGEIVQLGRLRQLSAGASRPGTPRGWRRVRHAA
jgi:hypothetical protein